MIGDWITPEKDAKILEWRMQDVPVPFRIIGNRLGVTKGMAIGRARVFGVATREKTRKGQVRIRLYRKSAAQIRQEMVEQTFSTMPDESLREAVGHGRTISMIRSAFHKLTDVWFRDLEIIELIQRLGLKVPDSDCLEGASAINEVMEKQWPPANATRQVRRGRYPVPPGGYSMIGNRLYG